MSDSKRRAFYRWYLLERNSPGELWFLSREMTCQKQGCGLNFRLGAGLCSVFILFFFFWSSLSVLPYLPYIVCMVLEGFTLKIQCLIKTIYWKDMPCRCTELKFNQLVSFPISYVPQGNAFLGTFKKCRLLQVFQAVTPPTFASSRIYNIENVLMLEGAN